MTAPQRRLPGFRGPYRTRRARRGLDITLERLTASGRLEAVDAAWVALARVAADELDAACSDPDESRYTRGVLIARAKDVYATLIARPDTGANDDLDNLISAALTLEGDAGIRDAAQP